MKTYRELDEEIKFDLGITSRLFPKDDLEEYVKENKKYRWSLRGR